MGKVIDFAEWAQVAEGDSPDRDAQRDDTPPELEPVTPPWLSATPDEAPESIGRIIARFAALAVIGWAVILALAFALAQNEPAPTACPAAADHCPVNP